MIPKTYAILSRAVDEGIEYGYMRAFKYTDNPSPELIRAEIHKAVMDEVCNVFTFEEEASDN